MKKYIHVYSGASDLCNMDRQALEVAVNSWLCASCMKPRVGTGRLDIRVRKSTVFDLPLSAVVECCTMVARRDFIDLLSERVRAQLYLGDLFDEMGNRIPGFSTVRAMEETVIRGSTNVAYRTCTECGRSVYYASGKRYLCPQPSADRLVLGSDLSGAVFTEPTFEQMGVNYSKRLVLVERLDVVNPPRDGLPEVLEP
jgi:hypothetical protein